MDNNYISILPRLREERERRNLTQRLLCYHMQIQQSHFSKAETGQRRFTYHELEGLCATDIDVLYVFTGKRPKTGLEFLNPAELGLEEIICLLNIVYDLADTAWSANRYKTAFEQIRQQLEYIKCGSGNDKTKSNIFHYVRIKCGYTQQKMADTLGIDIKKLRELEKGRLQPDSELIWKMYDLFHVSPALILKDPRGLLNELNYVLDLLEDDDREIMLRILENGHKICSPSVPVI